MLIISTEQVPKSEQHAHAHSLLSMGLREYGIDYVMGKTPVVYGEHGKPALAEYPEVHFNISHADGIAAAVVSEHECGVDCERVREYDPRVMRRVCSEAEQAMIKAASKSERALLFFRLWTLKEAYVKALGSGLAFPMREAEFAFEGDRIQTKLSDCAFTQYVINGKFVVAVCELSKARGSNKLYYLSMQQKIFFDKSKPISE